MSLETQIQQIYSHPSFQFNDKELSPSEWIEQKRYVQRHVSEKMFGQFNWKNTPYMRQIVDHLSPYDPVTDIVFMKGIRIGGTFVLVHNGVPYVMSQRPTNIMLLSANDKLATKTMQGVDNGIDGTNIRHLLGKGTGVQSNSKGDTMQQKFFSGGFELYNFGGQSDTNMRQVTAGYIAADEIDAYKFISKDGGNFVELMRDRASSYGDSKKIIYLSSPKLLDSSLIYELFLMGNQNVYYVPCPKCGEMIELVWNERNENNTRYGVIFDVRNDEVIKNSVRYRCGKCEGEFRETQKLKLDLINSGIWKSQIKREDKTFVSYRISALYAPPTMDNWYEFAKRYQKAFPRGGIKNDARIQSFRNSIEGLPYKPEGIKLKTTKLQQNRQDYKIGECPFELSKKHNNGEIMLISVSADLNGYEADPQHGDDARIDYEIMAHSEKGPTYSIDAGSVGTFIPKAERDALLKEGKDLKKIQAERNKYTYKFDVENSVWDEFEQIIRQRFGKYSRGINVVAVDIGYHQDYAMEFIRRMRQKGINCIAVKGEKEDQFQDQGKSDSGNVYRHSTNGDFFLLNVNIVKDWVAKYIESNSYIDDNGLVHQDEHFMNYPEQDLNIGKYTYRNYFAHFESEHKIERKTEGGLTKYIWEKKKSGIQNHFWDVNIYNVFCRVFMTDLICSNDNHFKKVKYGTSKIKPTWVNACRLIVEASKDRGVPLS